MKIWDFIKFRKSLLFTFLCLVSAHTVTVFSFIAIVSHKGAVIKNGTEGGGRDLTGSPKLSGGKYWANKLLQMINKGHEAICFWICFQNLQLFQTPPALFLLFL